MPTRKWIAPAVRVALLILFGLALWKGPALLDMFRTVAHVTVMNKAGEPIVRASVTAFGQSTAVEVPIPPGESRAVDLIVTGEGGLAVEAELASGVKLTSGETGYLTPGMSSTVDVAVGPDYVTVGAAMPVR
jgi:hypothetical protein